MQKQLPYLLAVVIIVCSGIAAIVAVEIYRPSENNSGTIVVIVGAITGAPLLLANLLKVMDVAAAQKEQAAKIEENTLDTRKTKNAVEQQAADVKQTQNEIQAIHTAVNNRTDRLMEKLETAVADKQIAVTATAKSEAALERANEAISMTKLKKS